MSEWDRQTAPGGAEGPQWVSAAEAADVAGVTPGTVRYWARYGLIVSEVVDGPAGEKMLVRLDEVLKHAREEGGSRPSQPPPPSAEIVTELPARTSELAPILKSIPEIMAQLTSATDRAARAETKVEFLSAQLADLRRRLAEAEAGAGGGAQPVAAIPEAWETPDDAASVVAEELLDVPAGEPGPDTIDWGTSSGAPDVEEPLEERAAPAAASREPGLSLDEIWNQPAAPRPEPSAEPEPEPAPETYDVARPDEPSGVDWHEPAGSSAAPTAPREEALPPRLANAPVPDGGDFYGPRRRRWFKRRR